MKKRTEVIELHFDKPINRFWALQNIQSVDRSAKQLAMGWSRQAGYWVLIEVNSSFREDPKRYTRFFHSERERYNFLLEEPKKRVKFRVVRTFDYQTCSHSIWGVTFDMLK